MALINKSEINLEISSGFFRISTEDVVYNITVLDSPESGANRVVKKIVDQEMGTPESAVTELADLPSTSENYDEDDYYKQVSTHLYQDIGHLAKSLSSTMMDIPMEDRKLKRVELDEAGEKIEDAKSQLKDIVAMTEKATMEIMDHVEKVQEQTDDVKELLALLKNHDAFNLPGEEEIDDEDTESGAHAELTEDIKNLQEKIAQANDIIKGMQKGGEAPAQQPAEAEKEIQKKIRYLFPIDTVFQTLYELCTNETVKGHISSAREQADSIFDKDVFVDDLTEKVSGLEADADNFYTIPLSDVLQAMLKACSDNKIQNLLKKMDANQTDIFLDQSLPLEVPPTEEVEVESETTDAPQTETEQAGDSRVAELAALMAGGLSLADKLVKDIANLGPMMRTDRSLMTLNDQHDIFEKIGRALEFSTRICDDVTKITEALSFQDLSGQQILKIIKLLSDFQIQLVAIVVSFGSQLKHKEVDANITAEESKRLAQDDVDKYLGSLTKEEVGGDGTLDQDSVNDLLEELGF